MKGQSCEGLDLLKEIEVCEGRREIVKSPEHHERKNCKREMGI